MAEGSQSADNTRAQRVEERLDIPVLIAALVSVPAVFLTTTTHGVLQVIGNVLNQLSGAVLVGESVLLLLLSRQRRAWIREHRTKLAIAALTVPAVVLLVGPVQVFRLLLFINAMRVLRVRRILGAGKTVLRRTELGKLGDRLLLGGMWLLIVVFVAVLLSDPNSVSRKALDWVVTHVGPAPTAAAGLVLMAVVLLARFRRRGSARSTDNDDTAETDTAETDTTQDVTRDTSGGTSGGTGGGAGDETGRPNETALRGIPPAPA